MYEDFYTTFQCTQCKKWFKDHSSEPECCVGGHWTPHSSIDYPPDDYPAACCHQYQEEVGA